MSRKKKKQKPPEKARILLVDDHPLVRQGLATALNNEADMEVCGQAEDVRGALAQVKETSPHLAVVDLMLKDSSGLELIKDMQVRFPDVAILVLSMRDEGFYAERVLRAGAHGYITKEEGPAKVIEGIRKVLGGDVYISEKMASKVMNKLVAGRGRSASSGVEDLTDRELEIFELIGEGLTTREIAAQLHVSSKTIDSHREHIKEKLGIDSANDLLKYAIRWSKT